MLVNAENRVFTGQRLDSKLEAWQMPQGGIDPGEVPRETALRELEEETGIVRHLVEVIAETPDWLTYDLPAELVASVWKGRYRGQRQKWFLLRFLGTDADVNIATSHPEFRAWQWADRDTLGRLIVPFKRELYGHVLAAFAPHLP